MPTSEPHNQPAKQPLVIRINGTTHSFHNTHSAYRCALGPLRKGAEVSVDIPDGLEWQARLTRELLSAELRFGKRHPEYRLRVDGKLHRIEDFHSAFHWAVEQLEAGRQVDLEMPDPDSPAAAEFRKYGRQSPWAAHARNCENLQALIRLRKENLESKRATRA
jgi:hypothetical protein